MRFQRAASSCALLSFCRGGAASARPTPRSFDGGGAAASLGASPAHSVAFCPLSGLHLHFAAARADGSLSLYHLDDATPLSMTNETLNAERMHREVLEGLEMSHGAAHPLTIAAVSQLAETLEQVLLVGLCLSPIRLLLWIQIHNFCGSESRNKSQTPLES